MTSKITWQQAPCVYVCWVPGKAGYSSAGDPTPPPRCLSRLTSQTASSRSLSPAFVGRCLDTCWCCPPGYDWTPSHCRLPTHGSTQTQRYFDIDDHWSWSFLCCHQSAITSAASGSKPRAILTGTVLKTHLFVAAWLQRLVTIAFSAPDTNILSLFTYLLTKRDTQTKRHSDIHIYTGDKPLWQLPTYNPHTRHDVWIQKRTASISDKVH